MPPNVPVDICVLTYGDHPDLVARCLDSLSSAAGDSSVRLHVGLNDASRRTAEAVAARGAQWPSDRYFTYSRSPQQYKYPLMRQILRSGNVRPEGLFVWFDDDSFVKTSACAMIADLRSAYSSGDQPVAVGVRQVYLRLAPFQREWVQKQPWFAGVPIPDKNVPLLPGSWWACPTALLLRHDWPPPDLVHNGGDILFSLLCAQLGVQMIHMPQHVAINADKSGKNCSQQSREPHPRTPRAGDPAWATRTGKAVSHGGESSG